MGAAALILTGCSAAPAPDPEPEVLSASAAGAAYLDAVCPVNAAWDQADAALERLRVAVSLGERDTEALSKALDGVAEASRTAASGLDPEQFTWPRPARAAVADVRKTLIADRAQAAKVAKLDAVDALAYSWSGADESAAASAAARAALELPEDPEAACAQRAEQLARERAEQPKRTDEQTKQPTPKPSGAQKEQRD